MSIRSEIQGLDVANAVTFFVDRHVESGRADDVCLYSGERSISYRDLATSVKRAGNFFAANGVGYEDRVLLVLPDSPLFVICLLGLIRVGAVPVPVSPQLSFNDYRYIAADCRPKGVVVTKEAAPMLEKLRGSLTFPEHIWTKVKVEEAQNHENCIESLMQQVDADCPVRPTSRDDMALIQYTSGSTGIPKGVVHLHRGLLKVCPPIVQRFGFRSSDRFFSAAKMSFGYGLGNSVLIPFSIGASTILNPGPSDPYSVYRCIESYRPSTLFAVPSLYAKMLEVPGCSTVFDLSSLRICVSAGEHLSAQLYHKWRETIGLEIVDAIGTTECLHVFISGTPGEIRPGSTGTVIDGIEAKLIDDDQAVEATEIGHLMVKGEANAARYWNKHPRTVETMIGPWTRTGDLFYRDEDGFFYYVGRSDDIINVRGMKVAPTEIEECLLLHESVQETAVVGLTDTEGITTVHAFVRLRDDWEARKGLKRTLKLHVRDSLSAHKCPQVVEFVKDLPRTTTGKIARYKLRSDQSQTAT